MLAANGDFDTTTSNSVLNVIDLLPHRLHHISFSCKCLKEFGAAYFKIWEGDQSSTGRSFAHGYQANRLTRSFQDEVETVFGKGNVVTDVNRHLIIAYKNSGCRNL